LSVRASGEDEDAASRSDDTARAFGEELKRRSRRVTVEDLAPKAGNAAPRWADGADPLAKSRALSGEGLEGLPARAWELLRLGFGFFLPFWPFVVAFSLLFTATYLVFGDDFLHAGDYFTQQGVERAGLAPASGSSRGGPPAYIVPEALLAEESADGKMVLFNPPRPQQPAE